MYEISEGKPFYFPLKILIWGVSYPTKFDNKSMIRFFLFGFILRCMVGVIVLSSILHFVMLRKENVDLDFSEDIFVIITGMFGILVHFNFTLSYKNISKFLNDCTQFTVFGKPVRFEKFFKTIDRVSKIIFINGLISYTVYNLNNYVRVENCIKNQELTRVHLICRVVTPAWWPHPLSKYTEWLIFTQQHIGLIFILFPGGMIYYLLWEMIQMIVMHFEVLKLTFPKIIAEQDERRRSYMLKLWIMYHVHVLKLSRRLNSLVKTCVGSTYLIAALTLGCIINMMSDPHQLIRATIILIDFSFVLFFLLDAGQKLQDAGISVYYAMCDTPWYNMDIKTKKDILFMMMSSNIDVCLSAFPIGTLNYPLLVLIMKGACSYFSLIQNTK